MTTYGGIDRTKPFRCVNVVRIWESVPNPRWRWWAFWRPKTVLRLFGEQNP